MKLTKYTSYTLLLLALSFTNSFSQKDTLYYDEAWRPTVIDSASFFRPAAINEGLLYRIKDYYITGELQMSGLSKSEKKDVWQGKVTWYNKDGSVFQEGNYVDNRLEGNFITFLNGKKLVSQYKNGIFLSGEKNVRYQSGAGFYSKKENDTIVDITYEETPFSGIRMERYSTKANYDFLIKYYGYNGTFLGKKNKLSNGKYDGIDVQYYYTPLRLRSIEYFKDGKRLGRDVYFKNGKPRELFHQSPSFKKEFFDQAGKLLCSMEYEMDQYGLKAYNGSTIAYKYDNENMGVMDYMSTYNEGRKTKEIYYHENQNIKTETFFDNNKKTRQIGYNQNGKQITQMIYKDYNPHNGTEIIGDRKATYKDGELVEETTYYSKSTNVFSKKTKFQEAYYDKEGKLLGTLTLDGRSNYPKPLSGTKYFKNYDGEITSIEEFKDAYVIKRTNFRNRVVGDNEEKKRFKRVEEYRPASYDRLKETAYYSNGNLQSETTYLGYEKENGRYYNEEGEPIGSFDFIKKDGIRYQFFYDSDQIEEHEQVKDGKQIKFKKYTYGPFRKYGDINPILIEDLDIDCCATYYDRKGGTIAKCEFKNGKPWSGELYLPKTFEKFTFKNGLANGKYQKLNYSQLVTQKGNYKEGLRDGTFTSYNRAGDIIKIENYKEDLLNGEAAYFDENGNTIGKMIYEQGDPIDGVRFLEQTYTSVNAIETYKAGKLVSLTEDLKTGKRTTVFEEDDKAFTTVYFPDSNKKRLSFATNNSVLNGTVIRFNERGKQQESAEIKNGKLVKGTLLLGPNAGDGNMKYYQLTKNKDSISVTIYNEDDKVLFQATEKLYFGTVTYYLKNLYLKLDFIAPSDLY